LKKILTTFTQLTNLKTLIFSALVVSSLVFILFYQEYFSLHTFKAGAATALLYVEANRLQGALMFMVFYFMICALPMPFVSAPTMLAGFLFGNIDGLLIVSFMSTIGGTTLFLITRYLCSDWIQINVANKFSRLQQASNSDSFMFALSLRLMPGMPFSIPAMVLGLSKLSALKFYCSTQLGLLTILFVYVNAGKSLSQINSVDDIFSAPLIISLMLLAIVPLAAGFIFRKKTFALN
jgi:uncharacterized membrane protein YdjX (TVP38/TMEM64 family)